MLSAQWVIPWWETYKDSLDAELCWLAGFSQDKLVGIAPFYVERKGNKKGRLRVLGDGNVCSDHISLLGHSAHRALFVSSITEWLVREAGNSWEAATWECIPSDDHEFLALGDLLNDAGMSIYRRPACSSWQVELPKTWDEYLGLLSKNQRKRCRRWCRQWIDSGKLTKMTVTQPDELDHWFNELCRLHNLRRNFLNEHGVFEDPNFMAFHAHATRELLAKGQLRLDFLLADGRPITSEYQFTNGDTVFSYQSGFDPEYNSIGAGNISLMTAIKSAIDEGFKTFDFLRGSEFYKQRWAATETKTLDIHVHQKNLNGSLGHAFLGTKDLLRSVRSMMTGQ